MLSRLAISLITIQVIFLAGCSYLKYPNIHKLTINQGNIIDQQMVDQLRPGLSRSQVRYILGTPLIADTFDQSRWDYFYSVKRPGRDELRERLSVYFAEDKLTYFTGDYLPSGVAAALESGGVNDSGSDTMNLEAPVSETPASDKQNPETYSIEPSAIEPDSEAPEE